MPAFLRDKITDISCITSGKTAHTEKLSVVIPCFNEERNIYGNIRKVHYYLSRHFETFEIIAVNDGSTDKTMDELLRIQRRVPLAIIDNPVNQGKGKVVKDGVLRSKNDIIMFLDADLGIPIEELGKFVAEIKKGCHLAIASRFIPGGKSTWKALWYRKVMERAFRRIRATIMNDYRIKDAQCGFKVFTREAAMAIFPLMTVKRFAFDSEIIFLAGKHKFRIKEIPVTLQNPVHSHVRIIRDPLNMLCDLIKIRVNHAKTTPFRRAHHMREAGFLIDENRSGAAGALR